MNKIFKSNLFFLLVLIYMIIGIFPLGFIVYRFRINDISSLLLIQHIFLIILPGIIYLILSKEPLKEILRLNRLSLKQILIVILIALASQPIMTFFSLIASFFFTNDISITIGSMSDKPFIALLGVVALLPSISEELILRVIVLNGYKKKSKYVAAIMTGIMFGIFHLNYHQFMYATVMGIILALVVIITNSIYSSMIIHFIINGISVSMIKVSVIMTEITGIETLASEEVTSLISMSLGEKLVTAGLYFIIAFVFFILVKKLFKKLEVASNYKDISKEDLSSEKVINLPFIATVIIYILYMIYMI